MEQQRLAERAEPARITYAIFAALVTVDLVFVSISPDFRNALGRIDGRGTIALVPRILPDLLLLFFYCWFLYRGVRWKQTTLLIGLHSFVLAALGFAAMIPWLGIFAAFLTPISVLYFGAILWLPAGYHVALFVALVFAVTNVWIGVVARRRRGDVTTT
jgi:hypothetical protein